MRAVQTDAISTRKRSNEEILSSLACTPSEAARVLNVRWEEVQALIDSGTVHSFPVGKRIKVGVESLKSFARGERQAKAA